MTTRTQGQPISVPRHACLLLLPPYLKDKRGGRSLTRLLLLLLLLLMYWLCALALSFSFLSLSHTHFSPPQKAFRKRFRVLSWTIFRDIARVWRTSQSLFKLVVLDSLYVCVSLSLSFFLFLTLSPTHQLSTQVYVLELLLVTQCCICPPPPTSLAATPRGKNECCLSFEHINQRQKLTYF